MTGLIHHAVARQAALRPGATAVIHGSARIGYGSLDAAARAHAARLAQLGVGPGHIVPVVLPRGIRLLTALLAVLHTGAAYCALDHRWPPAHLASLAGRLGAPLVVTDEPAGWPVPAWTLPDDPGPVPDAAPAAAPPGAGDAPATVFFTSGTTGRPKAVVSPHRAALRLFGAPTFADFGPGHAMPQAAPVPWDAFTLEVWGMLTTGGTCVVPEDDHLLPDDLRDLAERCGVDQLWLTSSLFNLFVDEDPDAFGGLRRVITGGERLSPEHVARFLDRHPDIALVNGYGPVESCVFATTHTVSRVDCALPDGIPLGRPVRGTGVLVLDGDEPVPPGTIGEICLTGAGLALGYFGEDPASANFTTHRQDGRSVPLYRTGDLGVLDPDGVLHYRGRADRQVKIAGHRVEPAEIEATTRGLPGVRDCAVLPLTGDDGGFDRLALFYTARPGAAPPEAVRTALAARLPRHLVPAVITPLPSLPRTPQGKLDRRALLSATGG
ncbi:amino acid adenylation domain-containing protein [Streptomyces sp. H51]|uniref:amino acid adenylation domain-containing protein n=1 Tax=Streptomyces sp. H51 TaxID=3111770 RepID=UPI002D777430|nr:amino acid adenylation domain-containing protein [Streptomyces sp. H51]